MVSKLPVTLLLVALLAITATTVNATIGQGTFEVTILYGSVQGKLSSATIFANRTVSLKMAINNPLATPYGNFQMTATGLWTGVRNGGQVSGSISNIVGQVNVKGDSLNFNGQGTFSGTLTGTNGEGTLSGTLTPLNSPIPEVPVNVPIVMSGTWTVDFAVG